MYKINIERNGSIRDRTPRSYELELKGFANDKHVLIKGQTVFLQFSLEEIPVDLSPVLKGAVALTFFVSMFSAYVAEPADNDICAPDDAHCLAFCL